LAETILCVLLFAACAFHVRWRFQMAKVNEAHESNDSLNTSQESEPPATASDLSK
jgi:hypothetical protein